MDSNGLHWLEVDKTGRLWLRWSCDRRQTSTEIRQESHRGVKWITRNRWILQYTPIYPIISEVYRSIELLHHFEQWDTYFFWSFIFSSKYFIFDCSNSSRPLSRPFSLYGSVELAWPFIHICLVMVRLRPAVSGHVILGYFIAPRIDFIVTSIRKGYRVARVLD